MLLCLGKALKDVMNYVRDKTLLCYEENETSAFTQKSLKHFYKDRIIHYGPTHETIYAKGFAKSVHSTRFRNKIVANISGLSSVKNERKASLTGDDEVSRSLFESFGSQ